jgi:hypothetical protein
MGLLNHFNKIRFGYYDWLLSEKHKGASLDINGVFAIQKKLMVIILKLKKSPSIHINVEVDLYSANKSELLTWVIDNALYEKHELHKRRSLSLFLRKWERHKGAYNKFGTFEKFIKQIESSSLDEEKYVSRLVIADIDSILDGLKLTIV